MGGEGEGGDGEGSLDQPRCALRPLPSPAWWWGRGQWQTEVQNSAPLSLSWQAAGGKDQLIQLSRSADMSADITPGTRWAWQPMVV